MKQIIDFFPATAGITVPIIALLLCYWLVWKWSQQAVRDIERKQRGIKNPEINRLLDMDMDEYDINSYS